MVKAVRQAEQSIGEVSYDLTRKAKDSKKFARSLFAVKDFKAGDKFTEDNVRSIRPGFGEHPKYLTDILGNKAKVNIDKGTPLSWDLISE